MKKTVRILVLSVAVLGALAPDLLATKQCAPILPSGIWLCSCDKDCFCACIQVG